jgi:ATP-binding cassette subfamily C (CFTR/MRP) protein 4
VVAIVNYWFLIPTAIIAVIFYFMRVVYITTSRSVKRLEGITRSPVFTHLNASIQGLSTIRAFRAQQLLETQFDGHQDLHSSAWYMFISTSRAFGFWLDIICFFYIALVTLSFLFIGSDVFGGNVGLAITQAIGLTGMFQWGMRQSAELENQMTSVERVLEFSKLNSEPPLETAPDKVLPKNWPMEGEITFENFSLSYSPNDPPVLKQISFTINPCEKIGIVGRTGAGKSSLISALFRLAHCHEGRILIDAVDISSLGLHQLRASISIIPQEPVLFSGTMRKNLDPFDDYTDAVLWNALEEVELKDAVADLPGGLSAHMSEGGSNFSVGQRQLVCLARAIVRNSHILVLDEATANVDPKTDALIQSTIRRKFASCTVLTIAHRLNTIMDSDRVLVMEAGRVAEFAPPSQLLSDPDSMLSRLAEQTGHANATNLRYRANQADQHSNKHL